MGKFVNEVLSFAAEKYSEHPEVIRLLLDQTHVRQELIQELEKFAAERHKTTKLTE